MTAMVFNCHYNGLSVIQELGRHGVKVLALDNTRSVGTFSRYGRYCRCPDPLVAEESFIKCLLQLGSSFVGKPVLFPTNDHWAVAVSKHKEALSQYYRPCVADYPTIELVIHKQRFYEWALSKGVQVPRSWRSNELDSIPDSAFPLAAKPEYRRISSNECSAGELSRLFDKMRLTVLRSRSDLDKFVSNYSTLLPSFIFQEYVEGLSDCMYTVGVYVNLNHEVLALFTGRKVRGFPPDIGDCMVGQVDSVPDYLKDLVRRICKEIAYQGIAEFEFKRDIVTGEFNLIEINPRSWSWIGITPACSVSLHWIAYLDLTGAQPMSYVERDLPIGSVKWVRIFEDLPNCLYRNRRVGYPQWHMTFHQWRQSLRAEKLIISELSVDDPLPALYSIYTKIRAMALSLVKQKFFRDAAKCSL